MRNVIVIITEQGERHDSWIVFCEKEILNGFEKFWKLVLTPYHVISPLLHVFLMISHSASPRARSSKKHVITYTMYYYRHVRKTQLSFDVTKNLFALKKHCSLTAVKLKIGMCMDEGSCQLPCESGIFTWNSYVTINEFPEIKNVP